jgi:hypothetical protein
MVESGITTLQQGDHFALMEKHLECHFFLLGFYKGVDLV